MRRLLFIVVISFALLHGCGRADRVHFLAGVSSGDVTENSVILWTYIEGRDKVVVEVSNDAAFNEIVFRDVVIADDSVIKVEVNSLQADTHYYYRFKSGAKESITGEFTTAPHPEDSVDEVRFAFSGDSNSLYQPFYVLASVRDDHPDFFIYLGDTIYSDDPENPMAPAFERSQYEAFYLENRKDVYLRELLVSTPVYAIWDDHEVTDNFDSETVNPQQLFNGRESFIRNFPIRISPDEPYRLYRRFQWGGDMEFFILDERQYRSAEIVCRDIDGEPLILPDAPCLESLSSEGRTFLGDEQKEWLKDSLLASTAHFKFIVSEVPITKLLFLPYDRWEGYPEERREILDFIIDNGIENVFFLSADIHANLVSRVENGIWEIVTGPIATGTLQDAIEKEGLNIDPDTLAILFPNIEFIEADRFAYTLIRVSHDGNRLVMDVQIKGENGEVLYEKTF